MIEFFADPPHNNNMGRIKYLVGIDEVGRGCLAGPVAVGVVIAPVGYRFRYADLGPIKDSKALTPIRRELWNKALCADPKIFFSVAKVNPRAIERLNISQAANLAALRAFRRLCGHHTIAPEECRIYLDGGLYLGRRGLVPEARTVVKADQKYSVVKAASIIAKVHRDTLMCRLSRKYPQYQLHTHKGYATPVHRQALDDFGPCDIHRLTFLKKTHIIDKK